MMKVRRSDVNLEDQFFKIMIKKGKVSKETLRPIKNIAIEYWKQALMGAKNNTQQHYEDPLIIEIVNFTTSDKIV